VHVGATGGIEAVDDSGQLIAPVSTRQALWRTLEWSRARDYAGYSKHDALNSRFLWALAGRGRFLRLAAIQTVMRFPVNLRPWLRVPRLRNPKGIGLFAHAYLDLAESLRESGDPDAMRTVDDCVEQAACLLQWLVEHSSPWAPSNQELADAFGVKGPASVAGCRMEGLGWGYHYPWQDVGFFQDRHYPNRVVSSWIGSAFLRAYEVTGDDKYLTACREIVSFLLDNPKHLVQSEDELCLSYVPIDDIHWAVMDVSALVAALCAKVETVMPNGGGLAGVSSRLMRFVVNRQTDYGAWFYTWPSNDSHIKHDNYHTGIILDALADYMVAADDHAYASRYRAGLDFYRTKLFLDSGAPRWMNDRTYPHDIHGAAAGVLAFCRAALYEERQSPDPDPKAARDHLAFADRILDWTFATLHDPEGYFYYRRGRVVTNRLNLMRWCNAWMCRAMAYRCLVHRTFAPA